LRLNGANFVVGCKSAVGTNVSVPSTVKLIGCDFTSQDDIKISAPGAVDISAAAASSISTSVGSIEINAATSLGLGTSTGSSVTVGSSTTANVTVNASTGINIGSMLTNQLTASAETVNILGPVGESTDINIFGQNTDSTFTKVINIGNEGKLGSITSISLGRGNDGDTTITFGGTGVSDTTKPSVIQRGSVKLVNSGYTINLTTSTNTVTNGTDEIVLRKSVLAGRYKIEGVLCYTSPTGDAADVYLKVDSGTFNFATLMFFISDKNDSNVVSIRDASVNQTTTVEGQEATSVNAKMIGFMGTISVTNNCDVELWVSAGASDPTTRQVNVQTGSYLEVIGINIA
jgi:hypothetical protein